jgi:hypothetical protein
MSCQWWDANIIVNMGIVFKIHQFKLYLYCKYVKRKHVFFIVVCSEKNGWPRTLLSSDSEPWNRLVNIAAYSIDLYTFYHLVHILDGWAIFSINATQKNKASNLHNLWHWNLDTGVHWDNFLDSHSVYIYRDVRNKFFGWKSKTTRLLCGWVFPYLIL